MPKEKEDYRLNLERLEARFPGREAITIPEAAAFLGVKYERLKYDPTFPRVKVGKQEVMMIAPFARRIS